MRAHKDPWRSNLGLICLGIIFLLGLPIFISQNFVGHRTSPMNACINNLRQLDGAIQTWAFERKKLPTDIPQWADLSNYLKQPLKCPSVGVYKFGAVGERPTCTIPGHVLPKD
jgi:hypothetical protein